MGTIFFTAKKSRELREREYLYCILVLPRLSGQLEVAANLCQSIVPQCYSMNSRSFCEPVAHQALPASCLELSQPSQLAVKSGLPYWLRGPRHGKSPTASGQILQPDSVTEASEVQNKEEMGITPLGPVPPEYSIYNILFCYDILLRFIIISYKIINFIFIILYLNIFKFNNLKIKYISKINYILILININIKEN